MSTEATPVLRTEWRPRAVSAEGYRQIVEMHYASRDADGLVTQPNWIVGSCRFDAMGEYSGATPVDIAASLPGEVHDPIQGTPRTLQMAPVDRAALATRLGYDPECFEFHPDFTGEYTADYLRHVKGL